MDMITRADRRLPRFRFTLRGMMAAVAVAAIVLAIESRGIPMTMLLVGPVCGAILQRWRGGGGILGGVVGGCVFWTAFGIYSYLPEWLGLPGRGTYDYLGPLVSFCILETIGVATGLVIGTFICLVADRMGRPEPHP